jgi:hypothetical protein
MNIIDYIIIEVENLRHRREVYFVCLLFYCFSERVLFDRLPIGLFPLRTIHLISLPSFTQGISGLVGGCGVSLYFVQCA